MLTEIGAVVCFYNQLTFYNLIKNVLPGFMSKIQILNVLGNMLKDGLDGQS